MAKRLGVEEYIRFTDRLNVGELIDYFTASDIMVSVTLYDGCPVSMLEGMAYGLIPAMSIHSPIQEWVTDGHNGYLFNPRDPESIAQAIIKALKNKDNFELMRERNWALLYDVPKRVPDISKIRNLGWEPKIPLDQGLKNTIEWLRGKPY